VAVLVVEGRPVLFIQERVGLDGRPFRVVKFRTMDRDAEQRFAEVAAHSETRGAAFKMSNDPRVTALGARLRRSSLDELPQLWNVLRGEMSLVGPRPSPSREVGCYEGWHRRRLTMTPGITGLWQVASRFDADFDDRATLDLEYIDHWSLALDLRILARTIPAVLRQTGR
jgi:lipopolysaccharide/colanic/teichoic acid biosynthesis glycosyltransferase